MKLYIIRHAQSENNARPDHERVEDPGLTEVGIQQANRLAEWSKSLQLTRLFCSPFLRTLLTTSPIAEATGLSPEVRVDLHEFGGCMSGPTIETMVGRPGMTRQQIVDRFPNYEISDAEEIDENGWWKSKPFETVQQVQNRASRLLQRTIADFAETDERVAYVMHADFKVTFLEMLSERTLQFPYNTSVSELTIDSAGKSLDDYNGVAHLTGELLTY